MAKIMNWPEFERKIGQSKMIIFTPLVLRRLFGVTETSIRFFVHRYTKKGYLTKLKRGLYSLTSQLPTDYYLANKLYEPSYISFEQALSFHHVIPETVYTITSATTKATRELKVLRKTFKYHRIMKKVFTGYKQQKVRGSTVFIAEPEKALIDYLYFVLLKKKKMLDRYDINKINKSKILRYAELYKNDYLNKLINKIL